MSTPQHAPSCPSWCTNSRKNHDLDWDHPEVAEDMHTGPVLVLKGGMGIRVWMSEPWSNGEHARSAGVWVDLVGDDGYTPTDARLIAAKLLEAAGLVDAALGRTDDANR